MSNVVIIKHPKCPQTFLFSVPDGCELHTGDFVTVDTKKGKTVGICASDSFSVPESALKHIVAAFGGSEPLRVVVGMLEERPLLTPPSLYRVGFQGTRDAISTAQNEP